MNTAYEYALPTQVARLMAGPSAKTENVILHGLDAASQHRCQPGVYRGVYRGSTPWLQLPILAATHPLDIATIRSGARRINDQGRDRSVRVANSAPVHSSRPVGNTQESLGDVLSNDSGSTIVISPYMPDGCSRCVMTRCTHDQSAIGSTRESMRSSHDDETPPPPQPPQQGVYGIHMGGPRDSVSTGDSSGIHEVERRQKRQWWHRIWLPTASQTAPVPSTVESVQSAQQLMARLQRQLDAFREDDLFLRRFKLLGVKNRRRGGAWPALRKASRGCLCGGTAFISATIGC